MLVSVRDPGLLFPLKPVLLGLLVLSSVPVLAQSKARRAGQGLGLGLLPTEEENGEFVLVEFWNN